jgi:monoamine oxidase
LALAPTRHVSYIFSTTIIRIASPSDPTLELDAKEKAMDRRSLFKMIGAFAGASVMYRAMTELGHAGESGYTGPLKLPPNPKGTSVLILGSGMAGMCAAYELRKAGYQVQILEYNDRPGGRNWSLYGGDTYTELGGATQKVQFDEGLYINPGPWRIPHHHYALIDYCKMLKVQLEPFLQVNYASYLHSATAFGGKPQRFRAVQADFNGSLAELLAKATHQNQLDQPVTKEDREVLLEALQEWGALDGRYAYKKGLISSERRGYISDPAGGTTSDPIVSEPLAMRELLHSRLWNFLYVGHIYDFQTTIFQPVGGMGVIGKAFGRELGPVIQYNAKVTEIVQNDQGVTVAYQDSKLGGAVQRASAQWCICTIPASVLSQIPMNVGSRLKNAIDAIPYEAAVKVGLQFKRRFWEQDDAIYGGISFTDLPNGMIGYPNSRYFDTGPGVLLGAYVFGPEAYQITALSPEERIKRVVEWGAQIHPQYPAEFQHGVAVGWHRVPWTLGCYGSWSDETRARHYDDLCAIDGRVVLAGEHVSRLGGWQEGALLSALDSVRRLHQRVMAS